MSNEKFEFNGLATAIGSMPHIDPQEACSLVLANLPDIPVWPQLPNRSFLENMYVQYSERFPGIVLEEERIRVDMRTIWQTTQATGLSVKTTQQACTRLLIQPAKRRERQSRDR